MTYARLDRANLSYANLRNANLDKTDLSRARLMRADLGGARSGAAPKGLTEGQLFGSIGNGLTVLPPHIERPRNLAGACQRESRGTPNAGRKLGAIGSRLVAHELALGLGKSVSGDPGRI